MKKFALIMIASALWLAGCGGGEFPPGQEPVATQSAPAVDEFSRRFVAVVLPPKVELEFHSYLPVSVSILARKAVRSDGG